jgi:hypothetical protein
MDNVPWRFVLQAEAASELEAAEVQRLTPNQVQENEN